MDFRDVTLQAIVDFSTQLDAALDGLTPGQWRSAAVAGFSIRYQTNWCSRALIAIPADLIATNTAKPCFRYRLTLVKAATS